MEPNAPKPYSTCDIIVKKESYENLSINGVQIFADSLSIQNVYLNSQNSSSEVFAIPAHSLYENFPPKIKEDSIKPNPNASGFVVLSRPVIPEYIIVHDGIPSDSSAPNYWIPYKDYIKNVCSSEIYPTWPYECMVANILVITSLLSCFQ